MSSPSIVRAIGLLAVLAGVASPAPAAWWSRFPFAAGEAIVVSGTVTDAAGKPLPDLEVILEASNLQFSLRPFGRSPASIHRVSGRTDARGQYEVRTAWDSSWDHLELAVGVPLQRATGSKVQVLERLDITRRLRQGSPAVVGLLVQDTSFITNHQAFLASLTSDSMKTAYREQGRPDRVDRLDTPAAEEVSWWYYEAGRVLRFRDGVLVDSQTFDPVPKRED